MGLGMGRPLMVAVTARSFSRTQNIWSTGRENVHGKERVLEGGPREDGSIDQDPECLPGRLAQCGALRVYRKLLQDPSHHQTLCVSPFLQVHPHP